MAKQLNVNLAFTADTGKAKAQIQELQNLLNQIAYSGSTISSTNQMQQDLQAASNAAKELQFHLNNAFNTTTGKFDLSLLDRSLKSSGSNLQSLANQIISIGPTGQQAFLKLAQSISLADQPMLRISNRMREFGTVMKNTIKWQLSSSMIHGFMSAINSAYGYAQDLNASLNDIRIVTGQGVDEMARFAEQANKAAKSLSTTTTDYTKASLIYYQQGLSDDEVAARTDVTIKMANAAGQSAQTVSDQLTAVWNNFYDGSKSLEYYADVMTALGAATASSTDEISQGLQKFAAVADTVGLSYEYATAALATITSNTRESADVVGTALKTLFARIQGLQLGETLDDGTDLNKYSQALAKVGISIYESNGELKAMDNILNEMAAKWDTMNAAQQTALAQTVAGVRQYTQLVALMENWNNGDGDSFQANLSTIAGAEGTLDQQAEIYAQSWEAAEKRVKAAAEGVYQSLLNDKFFISLNNGFANLLSGIDAFIEGLGGVKPLLIGISSIFLSTFAHKIPQALENIRYNLQLLSPKGTENAYKNISAQMEAASQKAFSTKVEDGGIDKNSSMGFAIDQANKLTAARSQLALVSNNLSESEKQMANTQLSIIQTHQEEITALKQKNEALQESMTLSQTRISEAQNGSIYGEQIDTQAEKRAETASKSFDGSGFQIELEQLESYSRNIAQNINQNLINAFSNGSNTAQLKGSFEELRQVADGLVTTLSGLGQGEGLETARKKVQALVSLIPEGTIAAAGLKDKLNDINNAQSGDELARAFKALVESLDSAEIEAKDFATALKGIDDGTFRKLLEQSREFNERQEQIGKKQTVLNGLLENFKPTHIIRTSEAFGALGGMMGNTVTVFRSISSALQAISNPDLSGWEKASTVLMSFSMVIPSVISGLKNYSTVLSYLNNAKAIFNALSSGTLASLTAEQVAMLANVSVEQAQVMISNQATLAKLNEAAANGTLAASETAETLATKLGISQDTAALIISKKTQTNTWAEAAAEAGLTGIKGKGLIATLANVLAKGTETNARWANVVAMIAEQTAMAPLLVFTLLLVAAMLALAAAVALVVVAAKAISNAYNADAIAAEKAAATARDLANAYQEIKTQYEDLVSAMEEYQSARDGLDDLTKGTEEFSKQLQEANRSALELINTYPDLFKPGDYKWENGELIISDEALARADQVMARRESEAYATMQFSKVEASEAKNQSDRTDLHRTMAHETWSFGDIIKTAIGSYFGTLAAGPMGGLQAVNHQYKKEIDKLERTDAINKAAAAYKEDNGFFESGSWEMMKKLGIYDIEIIKSLQKNQDAIIELSNNVDATKAQRDVAAETSARELMSNNVNITSSGYMDDLGVIGGKILSESQQAMYEEYSSQLQKKKYLKEYANDYFDEKGISSKTGFRVDKYNANKGIVSYSYLDENGERVEAEITADQIAQTRALTSAQEELFASCKTVISSFELLDKDINNTTSETSKLSEGLKAFLTSGGMEGLTKAQYDALSGMDNEEAIDYLSSMGITEKNIQDFGYSNIDSLLSEFNQPNLNEEWAKYDNITSKDGASNLNLEQVKNLQSSIDEISDFFGAEVGDQLLNLSEEMAKSLDDAGKVEFWEQLSKITDFSDAQQWEDFIAAMKESGDLTDEQIAIFEDYADAAQEAAKATKAIDFNSLAENLKSLRSILEKFEEGNRDITDEEFETLKANGIDTSQFAKTIDGYRFLGDSSEFMAAMAQNMEDQIAEAEQHFANAAERAAQASQNLADAEQHLEDVRNNADATAAASISNLDILKTMISNFVNTISQTVLTQIQNALNFIAEILLGLYDTLVSVINKLGDGLVGAVNDLMNLLVNVINGIADLIAKIPGFEDFKANLDWEDLTYNRMKTSEEIAAEEEVARRQQEVAEANQAIIDGVDDIVKTIEASAEFKSEEELQLGRADAQADVDRAQSDYDAAVATYGEDSEQAKTAKLLLEASQQILAAWDKAIESKFWGDVADEYDLDPQALEENAATLEAMAESSEDIADNLADGTEESQKTLRELSKEMLRFQKATEAVADNYDDWNETLTDGSIAEQVEIMEELETAYTDMLDLDMGVLSDGFLKDTENLKLMKEAAEGSTEAYNELQKRAAKDLLAETGLKNLPSDFANIIDELADIEGIDIGEKITVGDSEVANKLNTMYTNAYNAAIAGGKSVAEAMQIANAAINAVGFEAPEIEMEEKTVYVTGELPDGAYPVEGGSIVGPDGLPLTGYDWKESPGGTYTYAVTMMVPKGKASFTKSAENFGGGSGGSSSSGGGGGSSSEPQTAERVKKTDIVERYHEIDDALDDLSETMEDATEMADRLYGNDRIKAMEKVNGLLKKEIELNKQKIHEAKQYLAEDRQELDDAAAAMGVSFTFDEAGNITNYTQVLNDLYNELSSAIDNANADGDATDEEQEAIDDIQERIDDIKDAVDQYDETKELIEDLNNEIQDKLYEIYDNELEMFEYKVELDLELSEDSMKIIDFQMDQIEDNAFKAAESIALTSQKAENLYDTLMTNKNALQEAFGLSDIAWNLGIMQEGQEFTEDQIDLMKEYRDNIMDVIEEMSELRDTVEEQVMEVFDAWNDKLETNMDTLDHFGSVLDSYKNIVDIVGQDTMGLSEGFMQGIQEASVEHALDQMHATKEAYETMMSARLRAEQALEDARARKDDASIKMWEETLTELNSNMESAQEDMLSSWEDALSVIQDNFEATVERVVETFNNAVYAFGGMEGLSNEFSRQKEMADLMVDDYQKIYELSKLNRNIQKTLDDTDVIAGKQKLLKLQEKINALEEEGVELSQYDLEYLQAEYELRMAEIELANAQAKKDTVRLSKDNEGNWSYIYTTSVDAVDEAHQKYEDALYAMQELSSNYVDEMSEQLISTSQEMAEALAEVRASDFASQEDYEKELDRIRKMYQERLDQQEAELQKSINNNKDLYTQDWTNYHEATGYKISDTENFVTSFKDSMLGTLMQSESDTTNFNNIMSSAVDILTTGLVDAATTYYAHMEQAMQAAGTSTNDFATDMQENIDTVVQKSEEGAAAIEDMAEKMASAFWDISDSVTQWQEGYGAAMQQVIDSNLAVVESFNNMLKELSIDPDSIKVEYDISTDYGLENASSMDTGGYTGTWGTAGKLAILHEKELVLNPDDTSNFLQAIGISKTLLETIDLNAKQASNGIGLLSAAGFRDSSNGTLEQNVHIEATFPNVTDHNEIEEAMKNLVNTASQYVNRK